MRHEIVHNTYVVNDPQGQGRDLHRRTVGCAAWRHLVFSAHGVSRAVQQEAEQRGFSILTPPAPGHQGACGSGKLAKEGYEFIMIGHKGHPEVEGTMGQLDHGIHLVEDVADVARVQPSQTESWPW